MICPRPPTMDGRCVPQEGRATLHAFWCAPDDGRTPDGTVCACGLTRYVAVRPGICRLEATEKA